MESTQKALWEREHGSDYAVPAWIPAMFKDESWHNDTSPRFVLVVDAGTHCDPPREDRSTDLWVEHPDASQREFLGTLRYTVRDHDCEEIYATDSMSDMMGWLLMEGLISDA